MRLWTENGLGEERFLDLMYEARRRTKRALVQKQATNGKSAFGGVKNRMPYFFAVLDDLLHNHAYGDDIEQSMDDASQDDMPTDEAQQIWQTVLDELRLVLTAENYGAWLSRTHALEFDGNLLRVSVPTALHGDWLRTKLNRHIESTLRRVGYGMLHVAYVVAPDAL